ncbi:MAG: hypothetical protein HC877_23610 [Thioploca sp.]|nr:hypothetical protein [Thioploca sp.]
MLKIRPTHIEAFEQAALKHFEDKMLEHIKTYFSNHWRVIGELQLRKVIQYSVKQANQYDLTTQREVCLYLNLMLLLGSDFDTDIQLPWAKEVLKEKTIIDPSVRIEQLYDVAMDHLDQVAGVKGEYFDRVIVKVRSKLSEWMLLIEPVFEPDLVSLLNWLYPQKIQLIGKDILHQLIKQSITSTQVYGIATQGGMILYVSLMLILGSRFDKDPKYPWFATILNNASLTNELKVKVFYTEVRNQLDKLFERGGE